MISEGRKGEEGTECFAGSRPQKGYGDMEIPWLHATYLGVTPKP